MLSGRIGPCPYPVISQLQTCCPVLDNGLQQCTVHGGFVQELHRPDKQAYSSLLLETWLNEVLHTTNPATPKANIKVSAHMPPDGLLAHLCCCL